MEVFHILHSSLLYQLPSQMSRRQYCLFLLGLRMAPMAATQAAREGFATATLQLTSFLYRESSIQLLTYLLTK